VAAIANESKHVTLIATGGIASGLDAARAIALGAHLVGVARPVLKALRSGGAAQANALLESFERELRAAMLLTGSRDLAALRQAPRVLSNELLGWLRQL
jgi:isopentenyl-diphosphate delta-isomerase